MTHRVIGTRTRPKFAVCRWAWASAVLEDLEPRGRIIGVTDGRFSLLDLVLAALRKTGRARVLVSAWVTSLKDAEALAATLGAGKVSEIVLLVDRSLPSRGGEHFERLRALFGDGLLLSRVHAKFAVVENDEWSIAIRTSMNLNKNVRLEHFDMDDDPEIAAFLWSVADSVRRTHDSGYGSRVAIDERSEDVMSVLETDDLDIMTAVLRGSR